MSYISAGSKTTRTTTSILFVLVMITGSSSVFAGTIGTQSAEIERLQDEVAAARNKLDAMVLKPGMKLDDPRVREKVKALEDSTKALKQGLDENSKAAERPKNYPRVLPDRANGERVEPEEKTATSATSTALSTPIAAPSLLPRVETPTQPETALSGEGIAAEISYSKKAKPGKRERPIPKLLPKKDHAQEAVPTETATPDSATGLSEIQYPKKKSTESP